MIELNCSYEESKKILELGYDFRRVSNVFVNEQERFYNRANNYLAVARDITLYEICKRPDLLPAFFRFIDHLTPIIPKAALEACLPDFDNGSYFSKLHISQDKIVKRNHKDQWVLPYVSSTAFEVFIWCHENYPKELKKKFEEVMR